MMIGWRMKLSTCVLALGLAFAAPAHADFDKALEAYNEGNLADAFAEWKLAADAGDATAQWLVGNMYARGEATGAPVPQQAIAYYRKSAQQGYAEAQVSLGTLYRLGYGVERDYKSALAWLYEAAAKKHPVAQMDLGDLFLTGVPGELPQDANQALQWYLQAARQGVVIAQFKAAQLYLDDSGVGTKPAQGLAWMKLAYDAAVRGMEPRLSQRVMPLGDVVDADAKKRTLARLIVDTYTAYRSRYPATLVERAERMAREEDYERW